MKTITQLLWGKRFALGLALISLSVVFPMKSSLTLSNSFISPRLHLWSAEEGMNWRSVLHYSVEPSRHFTIQSLMEVGSSNLLLTGSFRMYQLTIRYHNKGHSLELGRQRYWSRMTNLRFDGLSYQLQTRKWGKVRLLSGVRAQYDFTAENTPQPVALLSWSKGNRSKNVQVTYWMQSLSGENNSFTGLAWSFPVLGIGLSQQISWDQQSQRIHNFRLAMQFSLRQHFIQIGIKQRRYMVGELFEWSEEIITIPPVFYIQTQSRLSRKLVMINQYSYRLQQEPSTYLHSAAVYRGITLGFLLGEQGNRTWYGSNIGVTGKLPHHITVGLDYEANVLQLADDLMENTNTYGAYGWLQWHPVDNISIRTFIRTAANPYFAQDGRGGLTINVTL